MLADICQFLCSPFKALQYSQIMEFVSFYRNHLTGCLRGSTSKIMLVFRKWVLKGKYWGSILGYLLRLKKKKKTQESQVLVGDLVGWKKKKNNEINTSEM